jgi:heat shock protein HtpX
MFHTLRTVLFFGTLTGLLVAIGDLIGGIWGTAIALTVAILTNISAYWFSDRLLLFMYKAREIPYEEVPFFKGYI